MSRRICKSLWIDERNPTGASDLAVEVVEVEGSRPLRLGPKPNKRLPIKSRRLSHPCPCVCEWRPVIGCAVGFADGGAGCPSHRLFPSVPVHKVSDNGAKAVIKVTCGGWSIRPFASASLRLLAHHVSPGSAAPDSIASLEGAGVMVSDELVTAADLGRSKAERRWEEAC
jgi:hypothetical protein